MRSFVRRALCCLVLVSPLGCANLIGADFDVQSEIVVDGLDYPKTLYVHDGFLYITAQGTGDPTGKVIRVPLEGGPPETFAEGLTSPEQLFYADGYMYWTSGNPSASRKALADGFPLVQYM